MINASRGDEPDTNANCNVPKPWHTAKPKIERIIVRTLFLFAAIPQRAAMPKNPQRYPPVTPKSFANPPVKPENTGTPIAPIARYTATDIVPFFQPSKNPVSAIAKVCSVTGMPLGRGIEIMLHTAIIAANIAILVMF